MNRMGFTRKHLIYGAITFVSLLGAILKVTVLNDPSKRLLTLYCLALYVVFLFWAIGQLRAVRERDREESEPPTAEALDFFGSPEIRPKEAALISAETYLGMGESLETICRFVEPRYADWTPPQRRLYAQGLRAALNERRSKQHPEPRSNG